MAHEQNGQHLDPRIRLVLEELRDLRREMRADRQQTREERQQADAERRQVDAERRRERVQSDNRFEQLIQEFRQDSERREAATQKASGKFASSGYRL